MHANKHTRARLHIYTCIHMAAVTVLDNVAEFNQFINIGMQNQMIKLHTKLK